MKVKFTKIGNKIKYELTFKIFCHNMECKLPHTRTLDKTDLLYSVWVGNVDKAFKKSNIIYRKSEFSSNI